MDRQEGILALREVCARVRTIRSWNGEQQDPGQAVPDSKVSNSKKSRSSTGNWSNRRRTK